LVKENTLLSDLHCIIQTSMGWENAHLHQFIHDSVFYQPPYDFLEEDGYATDYSELALSQLINKEKQKTVYEYDFGDSWRHEILLEQILPEEEGTFYPVCIKGKGACPPEDCGGVWGYESLIETLKGKKTREQKQMLKWLGLKSADEFDPEYLDIENINEVLKSDNYGVFEGF
jgi:hypothetical protein